MNPEAAEELQFWHKCFSDFNGQNIWRSPSAVRVIYSDRFWRVYGGTWFSNSSWPMVHLGGATKLYMEGTKGCDVSTVLQSFASSLSDERIRWFTDIQNVVRTLLYGSRKPLLQAEALAVFHLCVPHHLTIEPEWIPRKDTK